MTRTALALLALLAAIDAKTLVGPDSRKRRGHFFPGRAKLGIRGHGVQELIAGQLGGLSVLAGGEQRAHVLVVEGHQQAPHSNAQSTSCANMPAA